MDVFVWAPEKKASLQPERSKTILMSFSRLFPSYAVYIRDQIEHLTSFAWIRWFLCCFYSKDNHVSNAIAQTNLFCI